MGIRWIALLQSARASSVRFNSVSGGAAIGVGHGQVGIEPDRLVEVGEGLVVLSQELPGPAAIVEGHGVLGIELYGPVEVGDGLVRMAFFGRAVPRLA